MLLNVYAYVNNIIFKLIRLPRNRAPTSLKIIILLLGPKLYSKHTHTHTNGHLQGAGVAYYLTNCWGVGTRKVEERRGFGKV